MKITLFHCTDDKRVFAKTIDDGEEFDGTLKVPTNVTSVVVTIRGDVENLIGFNYAYIPIFRRYYFVNNSTVIANNIVSLELSVDVLMSYKEDINQMVVEVSESENPNPDFLSCEMSDKKTFLKKIDLQNPFDEDGKLYMSTVKGV